MTRSRQIRSVSALCGTLLLVMAGKGLADTEDPIDAALDACLATDQGQTVTGSIKCTDTAADAWNAKLNNVYQDAMGHLDPKSQDLLRASERKWIAFQAAEGAALNGPWRAQTGSDVGQMIAANHLNAIKERAEELQVYLEPAD